MVKKFVICAVSWMLNRLNNKSLSELYYHGLVHSDYVVAGVAALLLIDRGKRMQLWESYDSAKRYVVDERGRGLFDPKIRPGMHSDQIVRVIWSELKLGYWRALEKERQQRKLATRYNRSQRAAPPR